MHPAPAQLRPLLRIAALAALLALAACGGKTPSVPQLAPDAVVLAYGDSLTYGTGANPNESYPAVLERKIGRKVVSAGVPGETSAQGLARLPAVLDSTQPQLLVLIHGGNDFLRRLDEKQAAANLAAMARLARDRGITVVILGVPKPSLFPSSASFYGEVAKGVGAPYDPDTLPAILKDNELKSDPVHPNARGYAKLAEAVAALLAKAKAI
ncbi:MAG: GDSL-type esterase/lipase family protein [Burkholderiales bacterium]|jgi:lysophospholipase L1-like esterase|nr:GDSL-type esterase/lipase family protein [Burkholderiales bacterium]